MPRTKNAEQISEQSEQTAASLIDLRSKEITTVDLIPKFGPKKWQGKAVSLREGEARTEELWKGRAREKGEHRKRHDTIKRR
jgi:hypothetical protein